jgi:hypothetical protein
MIQLGGEPAKEEAKPKKLPVCDGADGTVGVDCLHANDYPKKLEGAPYAPTGMYYPKGSTKRSDSPLITSSIYPDIEPNYGVAPYADAHNGHEAVHGYHGHKIYA